MGNERIAGRFLVLAAFTYMLLLVGLTTLNGGPLALAIPLAVYLGAALFNPPPAMELNVTRTANVEIAQQGTPVEVTLKLTNQGAALDEVVIEDHLPDGVQLVEGKTRLLTRLPKGAEVEMKYTIRAPRGSFFMRDVEVTASDHLGVLRARTQLPARMRLLFLPQVTNLKRVAIRPARTHGHFGPIPSRQTGSGVDFYGLRQYQMGDPRRWINWRASARNIQNLFVNQFEQERIADVGIILDARAQSNIVLNDGQSLFEYSIQAAGSLSQALLNDGNRVGMLIYGFGVERTFPGYGRVQQERIIRALGQARIGHNFALESLGYLPTRFFPAGSQIVMVSPLLAGDVQAFTRLRATGYEVLVVSPNPVAFEASAYKVGDEVSQRIASAERALLLRQLQHMGIRVLDWPVDRPLEPLVRAVLSRVSVGRRIAARGL